jgi:nucleotide-binding universal stress UspA family protein
MYHRILVPLDGSASAMLALQEALGLATQHHARLHLLHVVDNPPLRVEMSATTSASELRDNRRRHGKDLLAQAQRDAADAGAPADTALREVAQTCIADAILAEADSARCDLIVMGSLVRRGLNRLLFAGQAERVARTSPVPVLLVRPHAPEARAPLRPSGKVRASQDCNRA